MFAEDKSLSIGRLCEKTGLSMVRLDSLLGGRASLTLPRAILRKASEKAGAGMCRLGLGQGGPCVCPPFRFLCHRGFSMLHDIDAFRCIVAEISDNLAGNKRTIVLIISALK